MLRVMVPIVVLTLSGCASLGEWRQLQLDGSSEAAFNESLSRMDDELPHTRSEKLTLALADIVRTAVENSEQTGEGGEESYSYEDLRSQLDGLTYEGVIAVADRTGPSVSNLYTRQRNALAGRPGPGPVPQTDTFAFPRDMAVPPGIPAGMATIAP